TPRWFRASRRGPSSSSTTRPSPDGTSRRCPSGTHWACGSWRSSSRGCAGASRTTHATSRPPAPSLPRRSRRSSCADMACWTRTVTVTAMSSESETTVEAPALVDPAKLGTQPQTARGQRTRAALIAAARTVFERDGYVDSRLVDIAAEAKCSIGSFYTWFDSKDEIFAAVLYEAQSEMLHPGTSRIEATDDPVAIIAASNRSYFEAYRRNARLNQLLLQVAAVD